MLNALVNDSNDSISDKTKTHPTAPTSACLRSLIGTEVTVLYMENGNKVEYKGTLGHHSQYFDIQLKHCLKCPVRDSNDNDVTAVKRETCREITLDGANVISVSGIAESMERIRHEKDKGFAVDSQISMAPRNRSVDIRDDDFEKWEPEGECSDVLDNEQTGRSNGNQQGWSVTEMLNANKKFCFKSDFESDLSQYHTVSISATEEERRRADEIAKCIENDNMSRHNAMLENDDEERNLDTRTRFDVNHSSCAGGGGANSGSWRSQPTSNRSANVGATRASVGCDRDRRYKHPAAGQKLSRASTGSGGGGSSTTTGTIYKKTTPTDENTKTTAPPAAAANVGASSVIAAGDTPLTTTTHAGARAPSPARVSPPVRGSTSPAVTTDSGTTIATVNNNNNTTTNNTAASQLSSTTTTTSSMDGIVPIPSTQSASAPVVTSLTDNEPTVIDTPIIVHQQQPQPSLQTASKFKFNPDAIPFVPSTKKELGSTVMSPSITPLNSSTGSSVGSGNNPAAGGGPVFLTNIHAMPPNGAALTSQNIPVHLVSYQQIPPPTNILYTGPMMWSGPPLASGLPPQAICSTAGLIMQNAQQQSMLQQQPPLAQSQQQQQQPSWSLPPAQVAAQQQHLSSVPPPSQYTAQQLSVAQQQQQQQQTQMPLPQAQQMYANTPAAQYAAQLEQAQQQQQQQQRNSAVSIVEQYAPPSNIVYSAPMVWPPASMLTGLPPQAIGSAGGLIMPNAQQQQPPPSQPQQQQQPNWPPTQTAQQQQHLSNVPPPSQYTAQQLSVAQQQQTQMPPPNAQHIYASAATPAMQYAAHYDQAQQQQRISTTSAEQYAPASNIVYSAPMVWPPASMLTGLPPQAIGPAGGPSAAGLVMQNAPQGGVAALQQPPLQQQQHQLYFIGKYHAH